MRVIEFGHWCAPWRDLQAAKSAREVWGYLFKPPAWRPDGLEETAEDLRQRGSAVTAA